MTRSLLCTVAGMIVLVWGCSSESVLTDAPERPLSNFTHTSFAQLEKESGNSLLRFVFAGDSVREGTLISAGRDSVAWQDAKVGHRVSVPTQNLARIERDSYTLPGIVGGITGGIVALPFAELTAGLGSGGKEPEPRHTENVFPIVAGAAFIGFCFGHALPSTDVYLCNYVGSDSMHAHALRALDEPSLKEMAAESGAQTYRFLLLRAFDPPMAVRVKTGGQGGAILIAKVGSTDPAHRYAMGDHVVSAYSFPLTSGELVQLQSHLTDAGFWNTKMTEGELSGDSEWIMEGTVHGRAQYLGMSSPPFGPFRQLCQYMLELSRLPVKRLY